MRIFLTGQIPKKYSWKKEEITDSQKDCPVFLFRLYSRDILSNKIPYKVPPFFPKRRKEQ